MQAIAPVTDAQLLHPVQKMVYRLEIWDGAVWQDMTALGGSTGKNYLKSIGLSVGGPGMGTSPVAGEWRAEINNENGIFHPYHPTSVYADLLRIGREVRIWVGAEYGGVEYYWQRLMGFMDAPRFDNGSKTVSIGGMDYVKLLADKVLQDSAEEPSSGSASSGTVGTISGPTHWGARTTYSTVASVATTGAEIYAEADALEIGIAEAMNLTDWVEDEGAFNIDATTPYSNWGGKLLPATYADTAETHNDDVGTFTLGTTYIVTFRYRRVSDWTMGTRLSCYVYKSGTWSMPWGGVSNLNSNTWAMATFTFQCPETVAARMTFKLTSGYKVTDPGRGVIVDQVSIVPLTGDFINAPYELPADAHGPYFVELDGESIWFGDGEEEWGFDEATNLLTFSEHRYIIGGDDLDIYYYTTQVPENIVADIMVTAGLYATRAAALADMDYTATGITIDRVWFDAGTTCLAAIQKICERLDYRFWFAFDGQPMFHPAPVAGAVDFDFPNVGDLRGIGDYQEVEQVRNYIAIRGIEKAMYATTEKTQDSRYKGELSDAVSIATYLEKTYSIMNNLFQGQDEIDEMCVALLADYKDPKWYADLQLAFNPVPLELGDTISWVLQLAVGTVGALYGFDIYGTGLYGAAYINVTVTGIIRTISINDGTANYKCEVTLVEPVSGSASSS